MAFDAKDHAERIAANLGPYDYDLDENWCDSAFESYLERHEFSRAEAMAIANEYIEMVYLPSSAHASNIRRAARTVEGAG